MGLGCSAVRTLHRKGRISRRCAGPRTDWPSADRSGFPRHTEIRPDFLQAIDALCGEWDALLSEPVHARVTLLSVHVNPLLALGLRAVLQFPREPIHVSSEFVERSEGRRIEGEEEVPDIGPLLVGVHLKARRGAAEDAAQDIDQEREAVAFVAAEVFAFATEGEEAAAEALREGVQDAGRIR